MEVEAIDTHVLAHTHHEVTVIRATSPLLFWIQLENNRKDLEELEEELQLRFLRRGKHLCYWPGDIKEKLDVVVSEENIWRRGWIVKVDRGTWRVKVCLGDYGKVVWRSMGEIYQLEDRYKELRWQAIACGLSYTGAAEGTTTWSRETRDLCRLLAEGKRGRMNIILPLRRGAALVKLILQGNNGPYNLRNILVTLGHAKISDKVTEDVHPAV